MLTVIIGNGAVATDLRETVNRADCVVRMNRCDYFGGNTGVRTDILALTTTGTPPLEFFNAPTASFLSAFQEAHTVILARNFWYSHIRRLTSKSFPEHFEDHRTLIEQKSVAAHKKIVRIGLWESIKLDRELKAFDAPSGSMPSTGMCIAYHFLRRKTSDDHLVFAGFLHSGWYRHPWDAERKFFHCWTSFDGVTCYN
jgi:hypothetical protein